MSELRDIAEFRSKRFSPVLPEDSQVNPQVYGAELAFWLCTELAKNGVVTSYPNFEDWGWFIEYFPSTGSEFAVRSNSALLTGACSSPLRTSPGAAKRER